MLPSIDENSSFSCIIVIFLNKILLEIKVFSSLFRFFNSTVIESKVILLRTAWHKTSSNGFTECYNSAERMQYFSNLNNLTLRETQALMSYSAYIMINLFYLLEKSLVPFFFCSWYLFFDIQFVFKNFFGISFHYILTSIQGFLRTFFFFFLLIYLFFSVLLVPCFLMLHFIFGVFVARCFLIFYFILCIFMVSSFFILAAPQDFPDTLVSAISYWMVGFPHIFPLYGVLWNCFYPRISF